MIARFTKITAYAVAFCIVFGASAYVTMTLLVKSGDTVVVPDLSGREVVQVLKILSDLGLNTKVTGSEHSDTVPENRVILQDPVPGTEIKNGRDVRIILSKGAGTVPAPELVGLFVQQARLILENDGLCQGRVSYTRHPSAEKEMIIAQVPSPEALIIRSRCVDLLISAGQRAKAYKMPDLGNRSVDNAIVLIENSNLALGEIKSFYRKDRPGNTVIGQEPPAGRRVTEGTAVHLVVNRPPGKSDRTFSEAGGFIRYRVKAGFLKRHIRVQVDGHGITDDLYNEYVRPGEEICVLIPTSGESTVLVFEDDEIVIGIGSGFRVQGSGFQVQGLQLLDSAHKMNQNLK